MNLPPEFPPRRPGRAELKKVLADLKKQVLASPLDLDARLRIARVYRLLDKPRHAIEHYRSVARYLALGGQPLPAMAVAKELLQVDPQHDETLMFLAKLYARAPRAEGGEAGRIATPLPDEREAELYLSQWPRTETGIWRALDVSTLAGRQPVERPPPLPDEGDRAAPFAALLREEAEQPLTLDEEDVLEERQLTGEHVLEIHTGEIEAEEDVSGDDLEELPPDGEDGAVMLQELPGDIKLPELPLFSALSRQAFVELTGALVHKQAKAGEVLWKDGDDALFVVLIAAGEALAYRGEGDDVVDLAVLKGGDFAGVFALLSERRRQASLKALTDLTYFELHRNVMEKLARGNPQMAAALRDFFRERVVANALALLPVFRDLEPDVRQMLAQRFKTKHYQDGDELFYDGAEVSGLWVILEGTVQVGTEPEGGELEPIRAMPAGYFVGTVAALEGQQTDGAAVAEGDVTTVTLSHRALVELSEVHPGLKGLRAPLAESGLSITPRIFGGSAQLPEDLQPSFLHQRR